MHEGSTTVSERQQQRVGRRELLTRMLPTGIAAIALNGCGLLSPAVTAPAISPARGTAQPRLGGTLRIGITGDIVPTAVPHVVHASNFQLNPLVYETLV